ncbi:MAG: TusE/DsrC/DsvC family sulfur relay protein [Cycloclasticus sp.]|nr:TusE/DsrC/DsvC family sulfur relay protein [Cycloclasticus sp.]
MNKLERDEYGFLKDRSQWSERVAEFLASEDGLMLSPKHWEIIHFTQCYYDEFNHQPNARLFGQAIKKSLGAEKGASIYLYALFPDGPLKYANKYAGLPIPPSCI